MCSIMLEDIFIFEIKAGKDLCDGHQKKYSFLKVL